MSNSAYISDRDMKNYRRKLRRQREIRRRFILAGIALILILIFTLSYHALVSNASTQMEEITYKYFTSIQIEAGDTLWSLADRYADSAHYDSQDQYIAEVMHINHMTSEELHAGNYLIVPYYSAEFVK